MLCLAFHKVLWYFTPKLTTATHHNYQAFNREPTRELAEDKGIVTGDRHSLFHSSADVGPSAFPLPQYHTVQFHLPPKKKNKHCFSPRQVIFPLALDHRGAQHEHRTAAGREEEETTPFKGSKPLTCCSCLI